MAGKYDQLHIMTKHPTISYWINNLRSCIHKMKQDRQTEKLYAPYYHIICRA